MDAYAEANANGEEEAEAEAEASVIDQWFDTEEDGISNLTNRAGAVMSAEALANAVATWDAEDDGDAEAEAEAAVISIAGDADGHSSSISSIKARCLRVPRQMPRGLAMKWPRLRRSVLRSEASMETPIVAETTTTGWSTD